MKTAISVQCLTKTYKLRRNRNMLTGIWRPEWLHREAVKDVSFDILPGESVAFIGPNGAGKTTTIKMMTGLIAPTSGMVRVAGFEPFKRTSSFLQHIGLVMGNKAGLNWDLSARQSLWLLHKIYHIPEQDYIRRLERLASLLNVTEYLDVQVRRLSLGERMKLELMAAIIHEPKTLFLDEPTIGLDIIAKKNIRLFLRQLQQEQKITLVLTSHDMDDVEQVCDRVLLINHGEKVYDDSLKVLLSHYEGIRYVRFVFDKALSHDTLGRYGQVIRFDESGVLLQIPTSEMVRRIAEITRKYPLLDMRIESPPLEEVIEELFRNR